MFNQRSIFILALTSFLFACNVGNDQPSAKVPNVDTLTHQGVPDSLIVLSDEGPFRDLRDFPEIKNETNVDTLISGIIKGECVYESAVGIGGAYTEEYAFFERLTQILSEKEMFEQIKHPDAVIRLYAFIALKNMNSNYFSKARNILIIDNAEVCTFSGCEIMTQKMKDVYVVSNEEEMIE